MFSESSRQDVSNGHTLFQLSRYRAWKIGPGRRDTRRRNIYDGQVGGGRGSTLASIVFDRETLFFFLSFWLGVACCASNKRPGAYALCFCPGVLSSPSKMHAIGMGAHLKSLLLFLLRLRPHWRSFLYPDPQTDEKKQVFRRERFGTNHARRKTKKNFRRQRFHGRGMYVCRLPVPSIE